mmetsp:Transcript_47709/g.137375  ORF Transcript_47709/g.137375 Transcript_47709/m.137375 type:complete len:373 (+) Transcript_47709:96-1214(+)
MKATAGSPPPRYGVCGVDLLLPTECRLAGVPSPCGRPLASRSGGGCRRRCDHAPCMRPRPSLEQRPQACGVPGLGESGSLQHKVVGATFATLELLRFRQRLLQNVCGQSRKPRNIMPVRRRAQARQEPIEKHHLACVLIDRRSHVEGLYRRRLRCLSRDRVVMRCKENEALHVVGQLVQNGRGNGSAVEGGRAAAQLVEHSQGSRGAMRQDARRLLELGEERALALHDRVVRPDPSEDSVDRTQATFFRIHTAAELRHDDRDAGLPKHGGLAAHVGPGDHQDVRHAASVDERVIWNEGSTHLCCSHRMATTPELERGLRLWVGRVDELGATRRSGELLGCRCQRQERVDLGQAPHRCPELRLVPMELPEQVG